MSNDITITDVGPVEALNIPIHPGVTVLLGRNDCGKSQSLDAVSRLAGGKTPLTCRDDAAAGYVEGLGIKIAVRRSPRRTGELEALSLEGRLSIADLVDPKLKDPVAADRQRVKALLSLQGVEADIHRFADLIHEDLATIASTETLTSGDLVEMAARLKRDLEAASRKQADQAKKAEDEQRACESAFKDLDLTAPHDAEQLQGALETAIQNKASLAASASDAALAQERAQQARQSLDAAAADQSGPTVTEAKAAEEQALDAKQRAWAQVRKLETELAEAKRIAEQADMKAGNAEQATRAAVDRELILKGWRETIEAAEQVQPVPPEMLTAADDRITEARKAVEQGVLVRRGLEKLDEAHALQESRKRHELAAESYREAAQGTDDVLSQAVNSPALSVKRGRLITQHPSRGEVFYAERSDGIRWKLAIDECVRIVRLLGLEQTAILMVPQQAWSELDPTNQRAIAEYAKSKGVCIVTAQATDGDLRAELFGQES